MRRRTSTYLLVGVLANVLVLGLCALLWSNVITRMPVYEEQIVTTRILFRISLDQIRHYSWTVSDARSLQDMTFAIADADDDTVYETRLYASDVAGDGLYTPMIDVDDTVPVTADAEYVVHFYLDDGSEYTGQAFVAFYGGQASLAVWYGVVCVIAVVICNLILALAWQAGNGTNGTISVLVVSVLVLLGILVNIIYPRMNVPDEDNHLRATYYASGQILSDDPGDLENDNDSYTIYCIPNGVRESMGKLPAVQQIYSFWYDQEYGNDISAQELWSYNSAGNYASYCYLPAAIALTAARALHASYQVILLIGRICDYMVFLLLVALTCRVAPDLRMAVLAIAGLPSTIWLAASYSYDGWNLGFSMLFIAYLWRLTTHQEQIGLRQIVMMVLLLLAFAPIKYIYVILALLVFAIPARQWKNRKALLIAILVGGIGAVIVLRSRITEVLGYLLTSQTDTRGLGQNLSGEPYTVSYVLHHPLQTVLTFVQTCYTDCEKMFERMLVGEFYSDYVPAYLSIMLVVLFLLLLLIATRDTLAGRDHTGRGVRTAWCYRGVLLLSVLAVYGSFLFLYSYYNKERIGVISGVQGRYFLPIVLLLAPAGSARLATHCSAWLERHAVRSMLLLAALLYVSLLVLLCRMPGFMD